MADVVVVARSAPRGGRSDQANDLIGPVSDFDALEVPRADQKGYGTGGDTEHGDHHAHEDGRWIRYRLAGCVP